MIKYIKHKDINKLKWDACIAESENGILFAYSWYLDLTCDESWDALVEDDYVSVFPLPTKRKLGIKYIYQPPFTPQLGFFSKNKASSKAIEDFLIAIPDKFKWVDLCILQEVKEQKTGMNEVCTEAKHTQLIDYKKYNNNALIQSDNLIRNIKKAETSRLKLINNVSPSQICTDFRNSVKGIERTYSATEFDLLENIIRKSIDNEIGETYAIESPDGITLASASFICDQSRVIYIKGSSNEEGKKTGAMHLLLHHAIELHKDKKTFFDFGGSNLSGLRRFYKSFGAEDLTYYRIVINRLPKIAKWLKR